MAVASAPGAEDGRARTRRDGASNAAAAAWAGVAALASVAVVASGLAYNAAVVATWLAPLVAGARRVWWWRRAEARRVGPAALAPAVFWASMAASTALAVPRAQFTRVAYLGSVASLLVAGGGAAALQALPRRRPALMATVSTGVAAALVVGQLAAAYVARPGDGVRLAMPVGGRWAVLNGGRSVLLNHHFVAAGQRDALDMVRVVGGESVSGDRSELESHHSWGADVRSPADGVVVAAVGGLPDLPVGQADTEHPPGNHVVLEIGRSRFVMLAHLAQGSLAVAVGETVRVGDHLGRVGNSGNTSEPHLHVQVQDGPNYRRSKTMPIDFGSGVPKRNDVVG